MSTEFASAGLTAGQLNAIVKKLGGHDMALRFLRGELIVAEREEEMILKLISGELLELDPVDGSEILPEADDVFISIDSDFRKWKADQKGQVTGVTPVEVYELVKDASFTKMFGSLSSDLDKLCLTQHQIKNFVKKHRVWLRTEGYGTFFLFKSNENFFVADVHFDSDGELKVSVLGLERDYVWFAGHRHRVVVPALAAA